MTVREVRWRTWLRAALAVLAITTAGLAVAPVVVSASASATASAPGGVGEKA